MQVKEFETVIAFPQGIEVALRKSGYESLVVRISQCTDTTSNQTVVFEVANKHVSAVLSGLGEVAANVMVKVGEKL